MMRAKIKLWDRDNSTLAELNVPQMASYDCDTNEFVKNCWDAADDMALHLTPSDYWGMEMVITCDFTEQEGKR